MASFLNIDTTAMRNIVSRSAQAKAVLSEPFLGGRGQEAAKIMRTGTKGVAQQFRDSTEYRGAQAIPWAPSHAFGTKPAPKKTMVGTGLYRAAFLGGAGSITKISKDAVEIGVDRDLFPQVAIHQGRSASRTIRPKKRTASGGFAMRFFLGLTYGVWFSDKRLARGLKIARRRVSVSSDVRKSVAKVIKAAVGKGFRAPKLSTSRTR